MPPALKEESEDWYNYFDRAASFNALKSRPNENIDLNIFTKCIVGKVRKGIIYFNRKKCPETYCPSCKYHSKEINKRFYEMIRNKYVKDFNEQVTQFLEHNEEFHHHI